MQRPAPIEYTNTSIEFLKKRLDQIQDKENVESMNFHFKLGTEYFNRGNFEESLKSHEESLKLKLKLKANVESIAKSYLEIGTLHIMKNNHIKGKENFDEARGITEETLVV